MTHPPARRSALAAVLGRRVLTGAAHAAAAPTCVKLRIEGRNSTIYEGPVTTDGKVVTPPSGGTHSATAPTAAPTRRPGPTADRPLDDGERAGRLHVGGTYFPSFDDYLVDRVGPDSATQLGVLGPAS